MIQPFSYTSNIYIHLFFSCCKSIVISINKESNTPHLRQKKWIFLLFVANLADCRNKQKKKTSNYLEPANNPRIFASDFFIHALVRL